MTVFCKYCFKMGYSVFECFDSILKSIKKCKCGINALIVYLFKLIFIKLWYHKIDPIPCFKIVL